MSTRTIRKVPLLAMLSFALCGHAQESGKPQSNVPPLPADIPADAEKHSMLMMGALAGQEAIWKTPDGKVHAFFQFNDRGRGPKTTTVYVLGKDGIPVSEETNGNDYLKTAVQESFALKNGVAKWKNISENGEKKLDRTAYYVSMYGPPEETAMLMRAALANGGKIALLPAGEVRVRNIDDVVLPKDGKKKRMILYAVTGLNFSPTYVWLDDDRQFFAVGSRWAMVIREGWENFVDDIIKVQETADQARGGELAKKLMHKPTEKVAFVHVNVFDAESGKIVPDQTVVIAGNKIESVGGANGPTRFAEGAEVIDGKGKTLLPGLWDMHAHVQDNDGILNLAAGVTTVRDLANDTEGLLARKKRIEEGKEIGTRIVLAGIIDGPGPFQGPTKVLAGTEEEARAAVDNYAKLGYVQIKVYSSVKPELVPAIVDEAHKKGLRVSGHIPSGMIASECIKDGFDEVQHVNFLMLNFMPDVKETRTPARFVEPGKRGASLDLNSAAVKDFTALLKEHHTTLDPTLTVFEGMYLARPGKINPSYEMVANRFPSQVRRGLLGGGLPVPDGMDETYRQSFAKMEKLVGTLYAAGVPIESGTDGLAGFTLERELELDVDAGIPAGAVLQNATLGAARIMKKDGELGSIAAGKLADVVLVDGNPTEKISDVRKTSLVMKDGVIYKPAELYTELGIQP